VDGSPSEAHLQSDQRSQGQRNHDALKAMGRSVLSSGEPGRHNGLPCTIVVTTTLQDLESGEGYAVTGGGSLLPMRDVIRLASAGQRIVLYAQDRGCTFPAAPCRPTVVRSITPNWTGPRAGKPTSPTNV